MIDYILESLFAVSGTVKHWELDLTDEDNHRYLYTNNDIVSESITINEKLFSITENDSITFGEFSANEFRAKLGYVDIGTFVSLEGMTMQVRVWLNNYSSNMLDIGTYTIVSDKITSDHKMREIIAYDNLSKFNDGDLSEWYHGMFHGDYIVRLHTIFQALIDTMGFICDTNYTNFPNVRIYEQDISNLKPSDLLINICELWAVFPTIGRNGHLQLISLGTPDASDGTHSNLSNPSYPGQINIGVNQYVPPCKSENYNVQAITRVNIRDKNGYVIYQKGEEGNDYYIDNNFLTFGMTQEELERIADFFIGKASIVQYRPYELKTVGNPCRECGDSIEIITPYGTINSYVFSRTLKGGQHLIDTFGAKGTKYRIEKVDTYNPPGGGSGSGSQGGSVSSLTFDNLPELIRNFGLRLLDEPSNVNISLNETSVSLTWTDPIDLTDNKPCPVEWAGTVVVRAEGKAPLNPYRDEYTIVVDSTTRDEYSENPFVDTVDTDKDYVYAIMPYDTNGHYRYTKSVSISTDYKGDYPEITSITKSGARAAISFTLPSGVWTSIKLVYKRDAIPQDDTDGTVVDLASTDTSKTVTLTAEGTYYFVIFMQNSNYEIESNVENAIIETLPTSVEDIFVGGTFNPDAVPQDFSLDNKLSTFSQSNPDISIYSSEYLSSKILYVGQRYGETFYLESDYLRKSGDVGADPASYPYIGRVGATFVKGCLPINRINNPYKLNAKIKIVRYNGVNPNDGLNYNHITIGAAYIDSNNIWNSSDTVMSNERDNWVSVSLDISSLPYVDYIFINMVDGSGAIKDIKIEYIE